MAHNSLLLGSVLNGNKQYTIEKVLGQGGFGITYLAKGFYMDGNIRRSAQYTIKELFMDDICTRETDNRVSVLPINTEQFEESKKDFKWEATCLFNLSQKKGYNRNIVPVNEVFEQNNTIYYVMDYLGDVSLYKYVAQRIAKGNPMTITEILDVISKVAKAVSFLHENYILHLDIKPENVMMKDDGDGITPVLIDFGLAKYYNKNGEMKSKSGAFGFSRGYAPVEQRDGISTFVPSADVYALSATLLYIVTGNEPIPSEDVTPKILYDAMPQNLPQYIQDTIVKGMARETSSRMKSVGELLESLGIGMSALDDGSSKTIRDSGGCKTQRVGNKSQGVRKNDKAPFIIGVFAVVFVIIAVSVIFFITGNKSDKETNMSDKVDTKELVDSSNVMTDNTDTNINSDQDNNEDAAGERLFGKVDWEYATYNGYMRNGLPDGKGVMRFKARHAIDPQLADKIAEKGEWLSGEFKNGCLVEGTLYDVNNRKKEHIDMRKTMTQSVQ